MARYQAIIAGIRNPEVLGSIPGSAYMFGIHQACYPFGVSKWYQFPLGLTARYNCLPFNY